jgi:hypothetical protein
MKTPDPADVWALCAPETDVPVIVWTPHAEFLALDPVERDQVLRVLLAFVLEHLPTSDVLH